MLESIKHFFAAMWFGIVLIPLMSFGGLIFVATIISIVEMFFSGYSNRTMGLDYFQMSSFVFLITNLLFRRCYTMIKKLYPLSIFALCNLFIISISEAIMSYGYEIADPTRHALTVLAIIIQFILCRVIMGLYFRKYPFN